ncbi:MAG TPA: DMT family transporter [Leptolyngbyaceae cyanobacterium M33_DOE_097]|uniref:DMT family transporter n=1 Tax=Oscillatoriales cyanobacterium SpSt-418 TaxID=2282169 RepID=A0A7C3KD64_9CYAN|nr:DMT family transporter [Leptolyngbyaceae cyanobacterium M33_DOE_097]
MSPLRPIALTTLAMLAFASNSLLCRMALKHTNIDPVSFTSVRLISGALVLGVLLISRGDRVYKPGNWRSAFALFVYAAGFSVAYLRLPAGVGALLLFGAVQITMISYGLWTGERFQRSQVIGGVIALAGLIGLLLPGLSTPPLLSSLLMVSAGIAWGVYSLRGQRTDDPSGTTAGNFLRAVPLAIALSVMTLPTFTWDNVGAGYAIASGAIASGLGYTIWYQAMPHLQATQASIVQLSVPIITAIGAVFFLREPITLRLGLAAIAVLGGIALVIWQRSPRKNQGICR